MIETEGDRIVFDERPERNLRVLASKKKSSGKKKGIAEAPNPSRLSIVH